MDVDYLIVGQGIAGTVLAHYLLLQQKKIRIVASSQLGSSSAVAAGLYNPITGQKIVNTWRGNEIHPHMDAFYKQIEQLTQSRFLYPMPIHVPLASVEEQNSMQGRSAFNSTTGISIHLTEPMDTAYVENLLGTFYTNWSGYLDVVGFMEASANYFKRLSIYDEIIFDYSTAQLGEEQVIWNGIRAKKVIFCEGFRAMTNPYFDWLPISATKGELLNLTIEDFPTDKIFRKKVFLIPNHQGIFKCGATYQWDYSEVGPTEQAAQEILYYLNKWIKKEYNVIGQLSGIRPTAKDRRPILGMHPTIKTIGVFNGLGSKGVSLAPFFAEQFVNFLEQKGEIDKEVSIERFYHLHN